LREDQRFLYFLKATERFLIASEFEEFHYMGDVEGNLVKMLLIGIVLLEFKGFFETWLSKIGGSDRCRKVRLEDTTKGISVGRDGYVHGGIGERGPG